MKFLVESPSYRGAELFGRLRLDLAKRTGCSAWRRKAQPVRCGSNCYSFRSAAADSIIEEHLKRVEILPKCWLTSSFIARFGSYPCASCSLRRGEHFGT